MKFTIRKTNFNLNFPWSLQDHRGYVIEHFRSHIEAIEFLNRHWFCECLAAYNQIKSSDFEDKQTFIGKWTAASDEQFDSRMNRKGNK